jgi:hypothetical protein
MYKHLEDAFESYDPVKKRKLLRSFVRRLEYDPKTDSLKVFVYAEPIPTVSVFHSSGAQDRT